jgi:hypothetical protein
MYFYTKTPQMSEKKGKTLLFDRIRHLVCLGNERRDSTPWVLVTCAPDAHLLGTTKNGIAIEISFLWGFIL